MKIGHKLLLGFIGLAILIVSLGYFGLRTAETALENTIGENSVTFAEQVLDKIHGNISGRIETIQAYASDELLKDLVVSSNSQFDAMTDANGYIEQVDKYWPAPDDKTAGLIKELSSNMLANELVAKQKFYNDKYGYPLFSEIFVTNRFGANAALTNKTSDYYQADENWWQIARTDGLYVGNLKFDDSSNSYSIDVGVRINASNGEFLGIIKAILDIRLIIDTIEAAKADAEYKSMQLTLVDEASRVIFSTKSYDIFEDAGNKITCQFSDPHKSYIVCQKPGEKKMLFARARSKNGLGWLLLMETDAAEIFAPIADLKQTMLLAGIAILALALLAGSVTYRSIVAPITELQNATLRISAGNLDTNLTSNSNDEIGYLARSFGKMTHKLKNTIDELNEEIAERKKAQTRLLDSKRFLSNIFDSIQSGISVLDKDFNIVMVNAWMEKTRNDVMPLVGKKCFDAYHKRSSICPGCPSVVALKTGTQHTEIVAVPNAENAKWWMEISASPMKDSSGNVIGVIEHVKDVTEQKKAESILTERAEQVMQHHNTLLKLANMPEQDLDDMLRNITEQDAEVLDVERVGVWFFTSDSSEIVCRDQFIRSQKTHESGESLMARDYPRYFSALENIRIITTNNAITDPRTSEFADSYLLPKGITSMIDVPIRLRGRIVGIICHEHTGPMREWSSCEQDFAASVADMISLKLEAAQRKKAEQAFEKLNKDLETTVEELSRSNRQLQDFVHVAAHDLKTPVRGIGTLADWIVSDYGKLFDQQGREQVLLLKERVVRIDLLIDGMLQFSKLVRKRQNDQSVNLNNLVADVIKKIGPGDNIRIAVDSLPPLTCEYENITLVFQNILSNAVLFMDKPKGIIKVGCVEQGDFWKFYVCDNGPGIDKKHFERIFRIFQTLPKKDAPQTAGVGLAIARKIIELYGGKIWVESQLGAGSTFFFTLLKNQEVPAYATTKADNAH